jgi:catechol 2,3-dioxygenase-like lactoylglutathione lyase family enzyme
LPVLRLEHVALNVADPRAMADWYVAHLGMRVVRQVEGPPHTRFIADASGATVVELYENRAARIPDYLRMDPLELHLAFDSQDPDGDCAALVLAGATALTDDVLPDGSRLLMLRDPWGLALQLCARATPLL